MRIIDMRSGTLACMTTVIIFSLFAPLRADGVEETEQSEQTLRLADLEEMALKNNPTLAQADASIREAQGRKLQAGLYPNPVMGYMAEELALQAISNTSEHLFFLEQTIVTAGKLKKSRNIFAHQQKEAEAEAEAQKLRVLNAVRLLYYEAVGAEQMVELRRSLAEIARAAGTTSQQLFNVGAADRPDLLQAEIELHQSEIDLMEAENDRERVWRVLAAVVGVPFLEPGGVEGDLEADIPKLDRDSILATFVRDSPEIKRARAGVERARSTLTRAKAEPTPDVLLRGGFGYNFEELDILSGPVGWEGFIEVGFRVPLFDRNQGNIAAARADIDRAEGEVKRLELALRARLAAAYDRYLDTLGLVERYQKEVLPRAQEAYDLYLARFREMGAAYPQVLIAQRTLSQVRVRYVNNLVELWQNVVLIRGMLLAGGLQAPEVHEPHPMIGAGMMQVER